VAGNTKRLLPIVPEQCHEILARVTEVESIFFLTAKILIQIWESRTELSYTRYGSGGTFRIMCCEDVLINL
jgi:hypothetical protein